MEQQVLVVWWPRYVLEHEASFLHKTPVLKRSPALLVDPPRLRTTSLVLAILFCDVCVEHQLRTHLVLIHIVAAKERVDPRLELSSVTLLVEIVILLATSHRSLPPTHN